MEYTVPQQTLLLRAVQDNNTYLRQIGHFDDYGSGTTCRAQEACGFLNLDGESTASSTRTMHDCEQR